MNDFEKHIEYKTIIGEANAGGYKLIRFTRIKYKNNSSKFIDIRSFQRGYDDEGEEEYFPTKKGFQIEEREFKKVVNNWTIIPDAYIHPEIFQKSYELIANKQYDNAVFQAFKILEVCIRDKAKLSHDLVGIRLVRKAFDPKTGPLTDYELPIAEREALSNFVAGVYGLFRNPINHRKIEMDIYGTFEKIAIASTIMKIVEQVPITNLKLRE